MNAPYVLKAEVKVWGGMVGLSEAVSSVRNL